MSWLNFILFSNHIHIEVAMDFLEQARRASSSALMPGHLTSIENQYAIFLQNLMINLTFI